MDSMWLIWSIEQGRWWKWNAHGYTYSRAEAGRYDYETACQLVKEANAYTSDKPNEAMVKDGK